MNNKAVFFDFISIILVVMVIGIVLLVAKTTYTSFTDSYTFTDANAQASMDDANSMLSALDWLPLIAIGVLFIFGIITASVTNVHPAFLVLGIILLIVAVVIAGYYKDFFQDFQEQSTELNASASALPISVQSINILPLVILGLGGVILVFLYAKGGFM